MFKFAGKLIAGHYIRTNICEIFHCNMLIYESVYYYVHINYYMERLIFEYQVLPIRCTLGTVRGGYNYIEVFFSIYSLK